MTRSAKREPSTARSRDGIVVESGRCVVSSTMIPTAGPCSLTWLSSFVSAIVGAFVRGLVDALDGLAEVLALAGDGVDARVDDHSEAVGALLDPAAVAGLRAISSHGLERTRTQGRTQRSTVDLAVCSFPCSEGVPPVRLELTLDGF
jgi:hypothetical protein